MWSSCSPEIDHLALVAVRGVPYQAKLDLFRRYVTASEVFRCVELTSQDSPAYQDRDAETFKILKKGVDFKFAELEWKRLHAMHGWLVMLGSSPYPLALSALADPPLVLFAKGKLPDADRPHIAFVGSRRPTAYGKRVATLLAKDLLEEGVVLVSGLARGIDVIGHQQALLKNGLTIAVTACGLDIVYPPEHAQIQKNIAEQAVVLTEFFLGQPPRREHFPMRNRIVSGLTQGVVVIEAGERSGARITARLAGDQGREVYAVPGPIDSAQSFTPNWLISQGAKIVLSSESILEDICPSWRQKRTIGKAVNGQQENRAVDMTEIEREIYQILADQDGLAPQDLVAKSNMSLRDVMQAISLLELKKLIQRDVAGHVSRVSSMES